MMSENKNETAGKVTINVPFTVEWKDIDNLIVSAFEGGCTYWLQSATPMKGDRVISWGSHEDSFDNLDLWYATPLYEGNSISLMEDDEAGNKVTVITKDNVLKALSIMATKYPRHWRDFITENDDAETADVFLQCCMFEELVYG